MKLRKPIRFISSLTLLCCVVFTVIDWGFVLLASGARGAGIYMLAQILGQCVTLALLVSKKVTIYT